VAEQAPPLLAQSFAEVFRSKIGAGAFPKSFRRTGGFFGILRTLRAQRVLRVFMAKRRRIGFVDGGVTGALLVTGLYVVVQQFEAHLIYPVVVKKVVGVPPLLVILSLIIGAKLAGFLGIVLSVPIAGAIQEFVTDIDRRKTRELSAQGLTPEGDPK